MIQKNIISKSKNDLTPITENTDTVQKLIELQEQDNSKALCVVCLNILSKSVTINVKVAVIVRKLKFLEIYSMVMSQQNTRRKNQASELER